MLYKSPSGSGGRCFKILVLLLIAILAALLSVYIYNVQYQNSHPFNQMKSFVQSPTIQRRWKNTTVKLKDEIRYVVLDPRYTDVKGIKGASCLMTHMKNKTFPICVYAATDIVSSFFHKHSYFEGAMVLSLLSKLEADPELGFIDVGANVGSYTLPAAHIYRRKVLAIEATRQTSKLLSRSVKLGNLIHNVTIIQNAIYGERKKLFMAPSHGNIGGAMVQNSCNGTRGGRYCINDEVESITLNDLLNIIHFNKAIMKIDAEGSEIAIMTSDTADEFFDLVDIPVMQMEWVFYTLYYSKTADRRNKVDKFVAYMRSKGYMPHNYLGKPLSAQWTKWPLDVLWLKKSWLERLQNKTISR